MGTDFLKNKRDRHRKAWRRNVMNAANGDLFVAAAPVRRVVKAKCEADVRLKRNDQVLLRLTPTGSVAVCQGVFQVAEIEKPRKSLVLKMKDRQCMAYGQVRRVKAKEQLLEVALED